MLDDGFLKLIEEDIDVYASRPPLCPPEILLFPPLHSRCRFLVHQLVSERFPDLHTYSIGTNGERRTVVFPSTVHLRTLTSASSIMNKTIANAPHTDATALLADPPKFGTADRRIGKSMRPSMQPYVPPPQRNRTGNIVHVLSVESNSNSNSDETASGHGNSKVKARSCGGRMESSVISDQISGPSGGTFAVAEEELVEFFPVASPSLKHETVSLSPDSCDPTIDYDRRSQHSRSVSSPNNSCRGIIHAMDTKTPDPSPRRKTRSSSNGPIKSVCPVKSLCGTQKLPPSHGDSPVVVKSRPASPEWIRQMRDLSWAYADTQPPCDQKTEDKIDQLSEGPQPTSAKPLDGVKLLKRPENGLGTMQNSVENSVSASLSQSVLDELSEAFGMVNVTHPLGSYGSYCPNAADDNFESSEFSHVVEIYDFPPSFVTDDLKREICLITHEPFDVKWVDDTHALGVFSSELAAKNALSMRNTGAAVRVRPLSEAFEGSRKKAKACVRYDILSPFRERPETSSTVARRMVAGALGMKISVPKAVREDEVNRLKVAKDKKIRVVRRKEDVWEGNA